MVGREKDGRRERFDGRTLTYQNWGPDQPSNKIGFNCLVMWSDGMWAADSCKAEEPFVCENPLSMTGPQKMSFWRTTLVNRPLHFWWNGEWTWNDGSKWSVEH